MICRRIQVEGCSVFVGKMFGERGGGLAVPEDIRHHTRPSQRTTARRPEDRAEVQAGALPRILSRSGGVFSLRMRALSSPSEHPADA